MPTRFRRAAVLLLAPALALSLAACGGSDNSAADGFDAVSVSGAFGQPPKFDWKKQMNAGKAQSRTLIDGSGPALAKGDTALVNIAVGDGWTHQTPITTFGAKYGALVVPIGAGPTQPQALGDLFEGQLAKYLKSGVKVGTRLAIAVGATQAFSQYAAAFANEHINIGNDDGLLIVADVVGRVPASVNTEKAPSGAAATPASWAPKVAEKNGAPTGLSFKGVPKPSGNLQSTTLITGSGPALAAGQTAVVKYLGQVYDGARPFDEDFSKNTPLNVLIGKDTQPFQNSTPSAQPMVATVIPGWAQGLIGARVGSRVLLQIPPAQGYGAKPPAGSGIAPNSTLYFVVDVLGAG